MHRFVTEMRTHVHRYVLLRNGALWDMGLGFVQQVNWWNYTVCSYSGVPHIPLYPNSTQYLPILAAILFLALTQASPDTWSLVMA